MDTPEPAVAIRDTVRSWSRLTDLAGFATERHGYGNTDSGFGINYPSDLDEDDREGGSVHVPEGYVQVYGFWGAPNGYELLVSELMYLDTLAGVLSAAGHFADAERVRSLVGKQRHAGFGDPPANANTT